MNDRTTFEAMLERAYLAYADRAPVGVDAAAVAAEVTRRGARHAWIPQWAPSVQRGLTLVLLGLLVAALVGTVIAVGARLLPAPVRLVEQPTPVLGAPAWDAIYLTPDAADPSRIDVVLARPDGTERLLRRIGTALPGASFPLTAYGDVSPNGWLAIGTTSTGQLPIAAYGLFDLAHAERQPLTVPYPPVVGGRWSPSGLFAVSSTKVHTPTGWMNIDVVDPRTGATIELGKVGLFGGGPSIVWASDGSGILDGDRLQPVNGGPDVQVDPGLLFTDRRVGMGLRTVDVCQPDCSAIVPTLRVHALSGEETEWYVNRDPSEQPAFVLFARDGRSLLVLLERTRGDVHTVVVARIDAPGANPTVVASWDLPSGARGPGLESVDPDDTMFALAYWKGSPDSPDYVYGPILHSDGTMSARPQGSFIGYVPGQLAESWPAEGTFVPVQGGSNP